MAVYDLNLDGSASFSAQAAAASLHPVFSLVLDGSASISAQASASVYPAFSLVLDGSASFSAQAEETTYPAFDISFTGDVSIRTEEPNLQQIRWLELVGDGSVKSGEVWMNRYIRNCEIQVDLAPGEEITVDSVGYCVTKAGNDITAAHSGDWLDELVREIRTIAVTPDSGTISAEISYTEKYL